MAQKLKLTSSEFWQRRAVQVIAGLLALGMSYALGSYAVGSGSLLQWALSLFWLGVAIREFICVILPRKKKRND